MRDRQHEGTPDFMDPRGTPMTSISGAEPLKCGTDIMKGPRTSWIPRPLGYPDLLDPRTTWIPDNMGPGLHGSPDFMHASLQMHD